MHKTHHKSTTKFYYFALREVTLVVVAINDIRFIICRAQFYFIAEKNLYNHPHTQYLVRNWNLDRMIKADT